MNTKEMKAKVLEITQLAFTEKLFAGTSGNLSMYDLEKNVMAITPSGISYYTMTENDIIIMEPEGTVLESNDYKPSSEWQMHASFYGKNSDINAVVHTHSPFATGFAVINEPIPAVLIEMIPFLGGDVKVAEFAMPGTKELGVSALKVLKNRWACLLANHGVLAIGDDLETALTRAIYTEDAAKICTYARISGTENVISMEAQNIMRKKFDMHEE